MIRGFLKTRNVVFDHPVYESFRIAIGRKIRAKVFRLYEELWDNKDTSLRSALVCINVFRIS